jgi:hypothetical protein
VSTPTGRGADDIDQLLAGPPSPPAGAATGGDRRGRGTDVTAGRVARLEEFWGHPDPGVFSWLDAPVATRYAAIVRTQRFTEWLIATFDAREIKPCWTAHPVAVLELWALERLYHHTHTMSADEPSAPEVFYNQVPTSRARLLTDSGMDACTHSEHNVPVRELPERVEARRATYETAERWTASWAWPDVDDAGQTVTPPAHTRTRPS